MSSPTKPVPANPGEAPPDLAACLRGLRAWAAQMGVRLAGTVTMPVEGGGPALVLPLPTAGGAGQPGVPPLLAGRSTRDLRVLLAVACSADGVKGDRIAELIEETPGSIFRGILSNMAAPEAHLLISGNQGYRLHQDAVAAGVTPVGVWAALSAEARKTTSASLLSLVETAGIEAD